MTRAKGPAAASCPATTRKRTGEDRTLSYCARSIWTMLVHCASAHSAHERDGVSEAERVGALADRFVCLAELGVVLRDPLTRQGIKRRHQQVHLLRGKPR